MHVEAAIRLKALDRYLEMERSLAHGVTKRLRMGARGFIEHDSDIRTAQHKPKRLNTLDQRVPVKQCLLKMFLERLILLDPERSPAEPQALHDRMRQLGLRVFQLE